MLRRLCGENARFKELQAQHGNVIKNRESHKVGRREALWNRATLLHTGPDRP
jgi:hypothetical protein